LENQVDLMEQKVDTKEQKVDPKGQKVDLKEQKVDPMEFSGEPSAGPPGLMGRKGQDYRPGGDRVTIGEPAHRARIGGRGRERAVIESPRI
jgi:hypothetical protein